MRRNDREMTGEKEILALLDSFDTLRLGLKDTVFPYVVPVNFVRDPEQEGTVLYFHCAPEGKKAELLRNCPYVCIECDRSAGFLAVNAGVTTRYESVIGFGECEEVTGAEKLRALTLLLEKTGFGETDAANCASLGFTAVYRITLSELTGKRNRMGE